MMGALGRRDRSGTVLYHAFYPDTRVMHVLMVDKVLMEAPPAKDVLGLSQDDDHPELENVLICMLQGANDLADEFGEELRRPEDTTPQMRAHFQQSVERHLGTPRLHGHAFRARAGIGMLGPAAWALHGWSLTVS